MLRKLVCRAVWSVSWGWAGDAQTGIAVRSRAGANVRESEIQNHQSKIIYDPMYFA